MKIREKNFCSRVFFTKGKLNFKDFFKSLLCKKHKTAKLQQKQPRIPGLLPMFHKCLFHWKKILHKKVSF